MTLPPGSQRSEGRSMNTVTHNYYLAAEALRAEADAIGDRTVLTPQERSRIIRKIEARRRAWNACVADMEGER